MKTPSLPEPEMTPAARLAEQYRRRPELVRRIVAELKRRLEARQRKSHPNTRRP